MQYADIYMVKYGTVWYGELYARSTQEYRNIGCWWMTWMTWVKKGEG